MKIKIKINKEAKPYLRAKLNDEGAWVSPCGAHALAQEGVVISLLHFTCGSHHARYCRTLLLVHTSRGNVTAASSFLPK